jgi:hypothetical protein
MPTEAFETGKFTVSNKRNSRFSLISGAERQHKNTAMK